LGIVDSLEKNNEIKLEPNQRTKLKMRFLHQPEYLVVGNKILINENNFKAHGKITKVYFDASSKRPL
jgi:GTPase